MSSADTSFDTMYVQVTVHGMLTLAVPDAGGRIDLEVPDGIDIQRLVEILQERSPLFDPRACLALIGGDRVPLNRVLHEGDHVHLHLIFGGG